MIRGDSRTNDAVARVDAKRVIAALRQAMGNRLRIDQSDSDFVTDMTTALAALSSPVERPSVDEALCKAFALTADALAGKYTDACADAVLEYSGQVRRLLGLRSPLDSAMGADAGHLAESTAPLVEPRSAHVDCGPVVDWGTGAMCPYHSPPVTLGPAEPTAPPVEPLVDPGTPPDAVERWRGLHPSVRVDPVHELRKIAERSATMFPWSSGFRAAADALDALSPPVEPRDTGLGPAAEEVEGDARIILAALRAERNRPETCTVCKCEMSMPTVCDVTVGSHD